jgi:hypothetical protein
MRRAILFLMLLAALAPNAGAAARHAPAGPSVDAAGLRGAVSPTTNPAQDSATAAARKPAPRSPIPPPPALGGNGQCRLTCAHSYYRCLAGDYAEQCPQSWTLCLADCTRASAGLR